MNRIPWQRIGLSIFGIAIIIFVWWWATKHLYVLPVTSITAFSSITTNSLYVIAALVIFFVTGQLFYTWTNQTTSNIIQEAKQYFEKQDVTITQRTVAPKYLDDPSIP